MNSNNIMGRVDHIGPNSIIGWAFDAENPLEPVDVMINIAGKAVGKVSAVLPRPDVAERLKHPSGMCGFAFDIPDPNLNTSPHHSIVHIEGIVLPFSNKLFEWASENQRSFFFLHIPKTAGTSFRLMLYKQFSQIETFPNRVEILHNNAQYPKLNEAITRIRNMNRDLRLVTGHYPYRMKAHLSADTEVIVFFRDPVARTISNLKHWKKMKHRDIALEELIDLLPIQVDNLQVRYLSNNFKSAPVGEKDLEIALSNLEACQAIGIVERFADSIDFFNRKYGWSLGKVLSANQIKGSAFKARPSLAEQIKASNELDYVLYRRALELFEQRC